MALLDPLGSPMESDFCTNGLCCSRDGWVSSLSADMHSLSISVMKAMQIFNNLRDSTYNIGRSSHLVNDIDWPLMYILLTLLTTLMCTILIAFRILRQAPRMSASRKIVEMLIESSAMYSISLIILLVLVLKNSESGYYANIIAAYFKVRFNFIYFWSKI